MQEYFFGEKPFLDTGNLAFRSGFPALTDFLLGSRQLSSLTIPD